jgi:TatA/E family protein of Tat protein translocase
MVGIFQPWHLIVVLVIVMMVFGPGKGPELGKAVGDSFRELKRATSEQPDARSAQPVAGGSGSPSCPDCGARPVQPQPFCGSCGRRLGG